MFYIRQSATHKVVLGPAVAVGDGFTPVTNLDVATSDEAEAILHDNGTVVDISGYTWAAIATADGYYHLTLQAAISGTVGHLTIVVNDDSLCLPLRADFTVLEEAVYDAMYAASAAGPTVGKTGYTLTNLSDANAAKLEDMLDGTGATLTVSNDLEVDLVKIHGSALTETAGQLAGRFVDFFNQASATFSVATALASFKATGFSTHDAAAVKTAIEAGGSHLTLIKTETDKLVLTSAGSPTLWTHGSLADEFANKDANRTFSPSTDSLEAVRDRLDATYTRIGADGVGLTLIPWNPAWDAEVESECADALTDYDPPTKGEMDTAHGLLATEAKQDVIDGVVDAILVDTGTTLPATLATIATDTARLTAARAAVLTDWINGGRLDLLLDAIKVVTDALTSAAATKIALSAGTIVSGAAAAGTLSTTQMTTNLTEATDDHYNGSLLIWTSGVLQNQRTDITDYDGTNKLLTFTAVTEAPSDADTFVIV